MTASLWLVAGLACAGFGQNAKRHSSRATWPVLSPNPSTLTPIRSSIDT